MMSSERSTLNRALQITSSIFAGIDPKDYRYKGKWETIWSLYNLVHIRFSIPYSEHEIMLLNSPELRLNDFPPGTRDAVCIAAKLRNVPGFEGQIKNRFGLVLHAASDLFSNSLLFLYSLISILIFRLSKGTRIALWTGDFVDQKSRADFRIGPLLEKMANAGIPTIELVRQNAFGFGRTFGNLLRRRRPAVYYESFFYFFAWSNKVNLHLPKDSLSAFAIAQFGKRLNALHGQIRISEWLFALLGAKAFVSWEFSDRQAALLIAAKERNLRTIGFMHGAGMRNYMAHEFMSEYIGEHKIGPDYFGVWSSWWKDYFEMHSRLYGQIEVSGPLRRESVRRDSCLAIQVNPANSRLLNVLWISEPLVEVEQVIDYIEWLKRNTRLQIKKRPSTTDIFYNALIQKYPCYKEVPFLDGNIFEAIRGADIVVGSHSTAVLDACLIRKPFVLVQTRKWGDYFELGHISEPYKIYVSGVEELKQSINRIANSFPECAEFLSGIEERFYGKSDLDGCAWVIQKVLQ